VAPAHYNASVSGLVLLLAAAIVASESQPRQASLSICDHKGPGREYSVWVEALRVCAPAAVAAARRPLQDDLTQLVKSKKAVTVRARLVPGPAMCTLMDCDSDCCNGCSFEWVVVPRRDCPNWRLAIRRAGKDDRFRGNGIDCVVHSFGARAAEVIVTGRLETGGDGLVSDAIVATDICRVESGDANRLSDADHARLMSPPPAEPEPRVCPRRPQQGQ
jgi:hypothetical protein